MDQSSSSSDEELDRELKVTEGDKKLLSGGKTKRESKLRNIFRRPLSVNSGDIQIPSNHSTERLNGTSSLLSPTPSVNGRSADAGVGDSSSSAGVSGTSGGTSNGSPSLDSKKTGCYGLVFVAVSWAVRYLFYSKKTRCCVLPLASIAFLLGNLFFIGILVAVSMKLYPPQINLSIEAFQIPSHPAQRHYDAFLAAKSGRFSNDSQTAADGGAPSGSSQLKRRRRSSSDVMPRSSQPPQELFPHCEAIDETQRRRHRYWMLDLIFRVPASNPDRNILTLDRIQYIHKIEETLRNTSDYQYFCLKSDGNLCDPLVSLLTWFYVRDHQTGKYLSSYNPDDPSYDLEEVITRNKLKAEWFTGTGLEVRDSVYYAEILRSQLRIGVPLRCFTYSSALRDQEGLVTDYLVSQIPILQNMSNSEIEILYGGSNIFDYEFTAAIINDAVLASISGGLILLLVWFLSGFSAWLTLGGLYAIVSCFIPAYFAYRTVFSIESVGLLNVVSIFVIIGIGVDDVFVFINTFKQSSSPHSTDYFRELVRLNAPRVSFLRSRDEREQREILEGEYRITHTILHATKATFITSFTTSVAFFANAVSTIPAIQQFGIFMGVVVLLCFVQVFLVIPHFLIIWHHSISPFTSFCKKHLCRCWKKISKKRGHEGTVTELVNYSRRSGNSSEYQNGGKEFADDQENGEVVTIGRLQEPSGAVEESENADWKTSLCTIGMQKFMLLLSMGAMVMHLFPLPPKPDPGNPNNPRTTNQETAKRKKNVLRLVRFLVFILCYCLLLIVSIGLVSRLKPSDKPPQFFSPSTNLQKVLDLTGNVTDADVIDGYTLSEWSGDGSSTAGHGGGPPPSGNGNGDNSGNNGNSGSNPTRAPPSPHQTQATHPIARTTHPVPITFRTVAPPPQSTTKAPSLPTTRPPNPATNPPIPGVTSPQAPPTQPPPTQSSTRDRGGSFAPTVAPGQSGPRKNNKYVNNAAVYVVLGVAEVKRNYNPTHVLPSEGDQVSAILDPRFSSTFSCQGSSSSNDYTPFNRASLQGAIRAICRLCTNISNPANGLVLNGNYECIPRVSQNTDSYNLLSCLWGVASGVEECREVFTRQTDNYGGGGENSSTSLPALASVTDAEVQGIPSLEMQFLAMAFRSTTNPGNSPLSSLQDYQKWEEFLSSELQAIKALSSVGELYEGAEAILSTFQTSDYWVRVNIENAAVSGSIYGIVVSFLLCFFIVVLFSHDWRLVVSMATTILAILLVLCALFYLFGWTLGIVEAISLSILVGNSLDYCIHLSEAFISIEQHQLGVVERSRILKRWTGLPHTVKKVMAVISSTGVSLFSSALTTIVAIFPLLFAEIQLFTRFGLILVVDTFIAIVFTLLICANFLAFLGPSGKESVKKRLINCSITYAVTVVLYVLLFVILVIIASGFGVKIPSPKGGYLF